MPLAETLTTSEGKTVNELITVQEQPADIGGYNHPDDDQASVAMRTSAMPNKGMAQEEPAEVS